jgi:DNA (cytosine-5)-methyltransferase 1
MPAILELFCGAGGSAVGYERAGFSVTGVDHLEQPRYAGQNFVRAEAFEYLANNWWKFDAIHAGPPCQRYSPMTGCIPGRRMEHPDHIPRLRAWLRYYGKPYVIENVPGAPLLNPVVLCGTMFGKQLYRHRLFETNFAVKPPKHPFHTVTAVHPSDWKPGLVMSVVGNCAPIEHAREIMGIPWMNGDELRNAIPPFYTEYIGAALLRHLDRQRRAARMSASRSA